MEKKRLNVRRLFVAMATIVISIVAADSIRRDFFTTYENHIVVTGEFKSQSVAAVTDVNQATALASNAQTTTQPSNNISYLGYSEMTVPASQLSSGPLAIINSEFNTNTSETTGMVNLIEVKNEYYSLNYESISIGKEAAEALNEMMEAYNSATGLADFVVYGTTETYTGESSIYTRCFPESKTGNTIDLAVKGYDGSLLVYDGLDAEKWIIENCNKYGYIVRYPQDKKNITGQDSCIWHLRYVGKLHAAVMDEKSFCLEEYVNFLKSYNVNMPLNYILNGVKYEVYYTASMGDVTSVRVPVSGSYTISGNNLDGFIVTAKK